MNKKLVIVVGTRPNFIKVTRFKKVAKHYEGIEVILVHTGQHYDEKMAGIFFKQFGLEPDFNLSVAQKDPAAQIGEVIIKLSQLFKNIHPNWVMCVGDVNSTLATAIVANKLNLPVFHLESGLRSNDLEMPEEWNRLIADLVCDQSFVTEASGRDNLLAEGKAEKQIHFVGNTMIDTLVAYENQISKSDILAKLQLKEQQYILLTMHRPSNVDNQSGLQHLLDFLKALPSEIKIVFPIHPRTLKQYKSHKLHDQLIKIPNLILTEPLDYFSFQSLIRSALLVITDSGGIQEETTFRQIPCLTLRENTERPITITQGTNTLVPFDVDTILSHVEQVISGSYKKGQIPELWDGKATERIMEIISGLV